MFCVTKRTVANGSSNRLRSGGQEFESLRARQQLMKSIRRQPAGWIRTAQISTSTEYEGVRALVPERLRTRLFLSDSQIAQFDCGVCAGEEADEARTDRDNPRRIYFGQNPDVDQPGLQHGTAKRAGKPKHDPKHKDERRLQGFFHYRFPKLDPVAGETLVRHHAFLLTRKVGNPCGRMTPHCDEIWEFRRM